MYMMIGRPSSWPMAGFIPQRLSHDTTTWRSATGDSNRGHCSSLECVFAVCTSSEGGNKLERSPK